VIELLGARVLESSTPGSPGIDAGHHVLDDAVLARRVHRLEDDEEGVAVGRVQQAFEASSSAPRARRGACGIGPPNRNRVFTRVGHFLSLGFSPGRTRKSSGSIFIFAIPRRTSVSGDADDSKVDPVDRGV